MLKRPFHPIRFALKWYRRIGLTVNSRRQINFQKNFPYHSKLFFKLLLTLTSIHLFGWQPTLTMPSFQFPLSNYSHRPLANQNKFFLSPVRIHYLKGQSYQMLDYILDSGKLNQYFLQDR
jgi:hypothetical protein